MNELEQIYAEKHPGTFGYSKADRNTQVSPDARRKLLDLFSKTRNNSPYSSLLGRLKLKLRPLLGK